MAIITKIVTKGLLVAALEKKLVKSFIRNKITVKNKITVFLNDKYM